MNTDYCKKCGACCKNIKIDKDKQLLLWDKKIPLSKEFENMLKAIDTKHGIYKCIYLKDNLCTNSNKPEICRNYPSFPFLELPENCGYEGQIFIAKENLKHKIRKLKEEIIHYTALIETTNNKSEKQQFSKIIASHEKFILKYKEFGSEDW